MSAYGLTHRINFNDILIEMKKITKAGHFAESDECFTTGGKYKQVNHGGHFISKCGYEKSSKLSIADAVTQFMTNGGTLEITSKLKNPSDDELPLFKKTSFKMLVPFQTFKNEGVTDKRNLNGVDIWIATTRTRGYIYENGQPTGIVVHKNIVYPSLLQFSTAQIDVDNGICIYDKVNEYEIQCVHYKGLSKVTPFIPSRPPVIIVG